MNIELLVSELEKNGYAYETRFLSDESLAAISGFIDDRKSEFRPALIGPANARQRNENVRGDFTFWLDPLDPPQEFKLIIQFLEDLKSRVNEKFFLGLKQFECHLAYYPPGTFYKKHLDRFESNSSRSLSFVFYLNEEWDPSNGGELVLYDKNGTQIETLNPLPGSFVCFLSEEFPHEVKAAKTERRSLTGWMHTKIIY